MKAPKVALLVGALAVALPTVLAIGPATAPLSSDDCTRGQHRLWKKYRTSGLCGA